MPERSRALQAAPGNELLLFLADLGAALSAIGETVDAVEERLTLIARAYGLEDARFSVFPTSLFLTLGRGEAATIEPTKRLSATPRLDQIAAVHRLAEEAERGMIAPAAGIARLEEIRATGSRYGPLVSVLGYTTLTIGIALILRPAPRDVAAAAMLGTVVGVLRLLARGRRSLEVLMPFLAAFAVALLTALAVKHDVTDPGLRAMIAALVVFIPGVALTTAVLELTEGQMISGSSRLVWATTQLGLIAFGIVAGVGAAGVPPERAFSSSDALLGSWAPWLGVLVYTVGVTIAHSTPPGALLSLLVVLYAAWTGQVLGDAVFGAYASGFVGAVVMTLVAYQLARLQSTMPVYAMFLPGFWLLVPGSLGLIGLTTFLAFPDSASGTDVFAVVGAIATVAKDVGTTVTGIQGAITAYTLVMAALMITGAKIGAIIGRKRAFSIGCVIYGCGSFTTSIAQSLPVLLFGWSLLEGIGAALILPAIVALVAGNFPAEKRPAAYGLVAAAGAVAVAIGPLIGGFCTTYFSWRWVFAGEVLLVIVILIFARRIEDAPVEERPQLDIVGAVLSALGLGLLVFGVLRTSEWGWVQPKPDGPSWAGISPSFWLVLAGFFVIWVFFRWQARRESHGQEPLVRTAMLRNRQLTGGVTMV